MRVLDVFDAGCVSGGDAVESSYDAGHAVGTAIGYAVLAIGAATGDSACAVVLFHKIFD
jgi:hypothetical protein